jgi:hypothetical protein
MTDRDLFIVDKNGEFAYKDINEISDQPDNEKFFDVLKNLKDQGFRKKGKVEKVKT